MSRLDLNVAKAKSAAMRTLPEPAAALVRSLRPVAAEGARTQIDALRRSVRGSLSAAKGVRRSIGAYRRGRAVGRAFEQPVNPDLVVWESYGGNGALCNPAALFREVVDAPDLAHLRHLWMLRPEAVRAAGGLLAEYADHPRVRILEYRSPEYFVALETASILVNNATFPQEYVKRDGQTYLNTWHGTPLKHMGYDEPEGSWASRNVLRNFLSADYLLSSGPHMTERMYRGAYRLDHVFTGKIIEDGFPRIDQQISAGATVPRQVAASTSAGLDGAAPVTSGMGAHRPLLLYAPTWRGERFGSPRTDVGALAQTVEHLRGLPELAGWDVRVKVHQSVYSAVAADSRLVGAIVDNSVDANALLARTDCLVTDFSSIFIDALAGNVPVVFFAEDHADYLAERGTYVPSEELPGPVARSLPELATAVASVLEPSSEWSGERYVAAKSRWVPYDDGGAAARVADLVFRGRHDAVHRLIDLGGDTQAPAGCPDGFRSDGGPPLRLIVHLGGLKPNGISTSAISLLKNLDPMQYDVTAVFPEPSESERMSVRHRIPDWVRQLPVAEGLDQFALAASYTRQLDGKRPEPGSDERHADDAVWKREWRRMVGTARFDVAIDFSGYSAKWVRLMLSAGCDRTLLWMHNDLLADSRRMVAGQRPYARSLTAVFDMLHEFDGLVSVSEELAAINATNLRGYAAAHQFLHTRNTVDSASVLVGANRKCDARAVPRADSERRLVEPAIGWLDSVPDDLGGAVDTLVARHGKTEVFRAIEQGTLRSTVRSRRGDGPVFVTVGRMSPEKSHRRLLSAFATVVAEEPEALLVLVGDGPLRRDLERYAEHLGITDRVLMTGQVSHPYAVLDEADCFVLSSDYEGQPMVILEALVLGLPVITTAFGSVDSALPDGLGRVVERDSDALAAAMGCWEDVATGPFDAEAYNAMAVAEFASAVRP